MSQFKLGLLDFLDDKSFSENSLYGFCLNRARPGTTGLGASAASVARDSHIIRINIACRWWGESYGSQMWFVDGVFWGMRMPRRLLRGGVWMLWPPISPH